MTSTTTRAAAACATVVLAFGLAACGGGTATTAAPTPSANAAAPTAADDSTGSSDASDSADSADDTADDSADDTAAAGTRVSANTASEEEIADALESAGVSNPERWAEEVVEYRPYPADDPDLQKLRDNLAKYNPGQETTDRIVSVLTP